MNRRPEFSALRLASTHNARLRAAFALGATRERRDRGLSLLEGSRFVLDCLRLGAPIQDVFLDESLGAERIERLTEAATEVGAGLYLVAPGVLQRLSGQDSAEGAAATVRIEERLLAEVLGETPLVVCHGIQNPGNLGAIIRTAAALGAGAVLGSGGSDPFGPKALRGAAGATFALPVLRWAASLKELCTELASVGYRLLVAQPGGGASHRQLSPAGKTALLLGGEASGLDGEEIPEGPGIEKVSIVLRGPVESLNVAVAAGILLERLCAPA